MKTKKTLALAVLAAVALGSVEATDLSTIIESAKENSPSYQNSVISYQNGLINIQKQTKTDDQIVVTVTGGKASTSDAGISTNRSDSSIASMYGLSAEEASAYAALLEDGSAGSSGSFGGAEIFSASTDSENNLVLSASPSVIIQMPNDGKTKITGTLNVGSDTAGKAKSIAGSVGVSHTIDFIGYQSTSADLSHASLQYNTEYTYRSATLNFEKTVLSSVSALLSAEKSMEKSYDTLAKQKKSLQNMEALGTYSTSSPTYIRIKNTIQTLEESLEAAEQQLEDARYNYRILTGMDWDYLDPLPEPVLELVTYPEGNTSVMLTSLSAQSALDNYYARLAAYNPNELAFSGNVYAGGNLEDTYQYSLEGTVSYKSKNWSASLTPSVTLKETPENINTKFPALSTPASETQKYTLEGKVRYEEDNWYVQVKPSFTISASSIADTTFKPSVSVVGKWTNKTSATTEDQELQTLMNNAQSRQNDFVSAMSSYTQQAQNLAVRIMSWNYEKAQAEADMDYLNMLLENAKAMNAIGLATDQDVADAELNISQAKYDWDIMLIKGLSLQRDLEIFAL
ncbi:MAG: hypothetical protein KBS81_07190 [Spirochaetales bacterium]|nr:hypothetical protein [Candidatus Physcosoma equi]